MRLSGETLKTTRSAYVNFLRAKCEMYAGRIEVESRPYLLIVDPCDACLLGCTTCPTGLENTLRKQGGPDAIPSQKRSAVSEELFDALMDELGDYLFRIEFFNWGEPLHNKNLPRFLKIASERKIKTEIHSHLSLRLSDEFIRELVSSGLTSLGASIDGFTQASYEKHRVGGDIELAKANLERIVRMRDEMKSTVHITYNFLVFAFNEHEIPAAKAYCEAMGIAFNARDAFINDPSSLPRHRKGELPQIAPCESPSDKQVWAPSLAEANPDRYPSSCSWHYGYSVVQPDGHLAPCCAVSDRVHDMGALVPGARPFGSVWNDRSYREARSVPSRRSTNEAETSSSLCTKCPWPLQVRHLYSMFDGEIVLNFEKTCSGREPVLREAFDLFCRSRYRMGFERFCQRNLPYPDEELLVGNENPENTPEFIAFVEHNLL